MRKKFIKWLSLACILLFSCGLMLLGASCRNRSYELYGFAPTAEISVTQGDFVQTESMYVFDSEENYYDVKYKVLDSAGAQVEMSGKGFFALEAADYKIVYTVISVRGIYTRETLVKVTEGGGQRLSIYVPETGAVNEPVEIVVENSLLQTYTFTVRVTCGNDTRDVENWTFTPVQSGLHTVTVTAVSGEETVTQTYSVNVSEEMLEGTVEIFDENWANKRGSWGVVTTAESGVKDRFGGEGSYLSVETDIEYLNAYVSPKMDKKYYEQLAEEGYEYVSVWIYLDCRFAHTVQQSKGGGVFYQTAHKVLPKTWYEIRYNLKDDPKYDYEGSFLKGFNYYASQTQYLFLVDNSDAYNWPNGGRERDEQGNIVPFKIYIDDIYAVKQGESIRVNEAVKPALKTGDAYDLKNLIDSEVKNELLYTVTYRNQTTVAEGGNYTFTANGTYEISASYGAGTPNRYGGVSVTLNVESEYTASVDSLIREKTGDSAEVDLNHLNVALKNENGAPVSVGEFRYHVSKNGQTIPVNGSKVQLTSVGCYDVEVEIGYRSGGTDCTLYVPAVLDVWDEASKYTVFDFDGNSEYFADSYYMNKGWDIVPAPAVVNEAHGKQGSFAKIEITNQQQPIFGVKPMYSLNYYRQLLADAERDDLGELSVSFDYFVEDVQNAASTGSRRVGVFPDSGRTQSVRCGAWNTVSFPMADFVNGYYAQMASGFDYLNGLRGGENITIDAALGYAFLYLMNFNVYATNLYIGSGKVQVRGPLTAEEWLTMVNGDKTAADYTQEGYADLWGTEWTYFQRNHNVWPRANASEIVTGTVGGVSGRYAKIVPASDINYDKTVSVYLPNTMSTSVLKEFAASGFVLKVSVYIDAPAQTRDAYVLEYDEGASAFKTITSSSRTLRIATGTWQEVEIDLTDYIRLCEQLGNHYGEQINNDTQGVLGIQVKGPWAMYFGEPYLALPAADEEISATEGDAVDFAQYLPGDGETYEIYTLIDGVFEPLGGTGLTAGDQSFRAVIARVERYTRKVVKVVAVTVTDPEAVAAEWLAMANGEKRVTDYTQGGYTDLYYETGLTYFQRNHNVWPRSGASEIVTETVGGVNGRYAKIVPTSDIIYDQTVSVYLPNTMSTATLEKFAASGFVLKVKVFVDAPEQVRNAFVLEYDESASAFKKITESSRTLRITTGTWQEIEIDLTDYIRLCKQLGAYYEQQIDNATQGVLGIQVKGPWAMYFSELYVGLPAADEEISAAEGETADFSQAIPDGGTYEIYRSENGVLTKFAGASVTVGAENLDFVVVEVTDTERTIVKVIGVRPLAALPADPDTVTDYTRGSYTDLYYDTGLTYFQRNHNVWPRAQASEIVTETVGGVSGTYAKIVTAPDINYDKTVSVYLPNTMSTETLKQYADAGYRLNVKVYIDAPEQARNAYVLEYDEDAAAFKTITSSSRTLLITTGAWQEIEIDLTDYIRLCEQLGDYYGEQIDNDKQGILGIQVSGPWAMYFSELYLTAPAD